MIRVLGISHPNHTVIRKKRDNVQHKMYTVLIILSCILSQFADEKELIYLEIKDHGKEM